jgi:hypothetical protein
MELPRDLGHRQACRVMQDDGSTVVRRQVAQRVCEPNGIGIRLISGSSARVRKIGP